MPYSLSEVEVELESDHYYFDEQLVVIEKCRNFMMNLKATPYSNQKSCKILMFTTDIIVTFMAVF